MLSRMAVSVAQSCPRCSAEWPDIRNSHCAPEPIQHTERRNTVQYCTDCKRRAGYFKIKLSASPPQVTQRHVLGPGW